MYFCKVWSSCVICTRVLSISAMQCGWFSTTINLGWGFQTADRNSFELLERLGNFFRQRTYSIGVNCEQFICSSKNVCKTWKSKAKAKQKNQRLLRQYWPDKNLSSHNQLLSADPLQLSGSIWRTVLKTADYLFFSPLTVSESLSFFLSFFVFHPSLPPCRKHKACHIHWTIPCLLFQASQVGQQSQERPAAAGAAEGSATVQAEQATPWAQNTPQPLQTIWMESERSGTGTQGLVFSKFNMHLKKSLFIKLFSI